MAEPRTTWPIWVFGTTVLSALAFFAVTFTYSIYTDRIGQQKAQLDKNRAAYEAEIQELQKRLVVDRVITEEISTAVTTRKCTRLPIGRMCHPDVKIEKRQITKTVQVQDQNARQRLDEAYKSLQALSLKAVATQADRVKLEDVRNLIRTVMAPLISALVLASSLYVILSSKYKAESEKWALTARPGGGHARPLARGRPAAAARWR